MTAGNDTSADASRDGGGGLGDDNGVSVVNHIINEFTHLENKTDKSALGGGRVTARAPDDMT